MDYNCFADNLVYRETVCQKNRQGSAAIAKQGRQISCVVGVSAAVWVIVGHDVCKLVAGIACAGSAAVDMEAENTLAARSISFGKSGDLSKYYRAVLRLIKTHESVQIGISIAAVQNCDRLGLTLKQRYDWELWAVVQNSVHGKNLLRHCMQLLMPVFTFGCALHTIEQEVVL